MRYIFYFRSCIFIFTPFIGKIKKIHFFNFGCRFKREDNPVACYKDLGCFEASGPFGYLDTLPDKPEDIATKFLMFPGRRRRKRGSPPAEVPFDKLDEAFEWAKDGFNGSLPTKVLIHGFGSDCNYIWVYEIRSALMAVVSIFIRIIGGNLNHSY